MKRIILMVLAGVLVSLPVFAQQTYKTTVKRTPVKRAPVQKPLKVAPAPAEAEVRSEAMQPDAQLPPEEAVRPVTEPEVQPLDREVVEPMAEPPKEAAPGMFLGTIEAEKVESKITKVLVHIKTADWKGAGTDEKIYISFGCDKGWKSCRFPDLKLSHERTVGCEDDCDNFERGNTNIFEFDASRDALGLTKEDLKTFVLSMQKKLSYWTDIKYAWLMEGLKIEYIEETIIGDVSKGERKRLAYWNPCVGRWVYDYHDWDIYGVNDTAVCAVVETSVVDKAGTDDAVWLEFADYNYEPSPHSHNPSYLSVGYDSAEPEVGYAAHFCEYHDKLYMRLALRLARPLSLIGDGQLGSAPRRWKSMYDNFERGKRTSYGAYSYDRNYFSSTGGKPKRVRVVKQKDGKGGGFRMERLEVFVYQPGKDFKYADHCKPDQNCAVKLAGPIYYLDKTFTGEEGHLSDAAGLRTKSLHFETLTEWTKELLPGRFSKIGGYF